MCGYHTVLYIYLFTQLDLEAEGRNLMRFHGILANHQNVKFPSPFFPYVTKSVLVESFEVRTDTAVASVSVWCNVAFVLFFSKCGPFLVVLLLLTGRN